MNADHERDRFDRLLRRAAWPPTPPDLADRIMRRIEVGPARRIWPAPTFVAQGTSVGQSALLMMAMVTIFWVGSMAHSVIFSGQSSATRVAASYYTGPGLYLYQRFGS